MLPPFWARSAVFVEGDCRTLNAEPKFSENETVPANLAVSAAQLVKPGVAAVHLVLEAASPAETEPRLTVVAATEPNSPAGLPVCPEVLVIASDMDCVPAAAAVAFMRTLVMRNVRATPDEVPGGNTGTPVKVTTLPRTLPCQVLSETVGAPPAVAVPDATLKF